MDYNSFRKKDMRMERVLADYLDKNLYSQNIFSHRSRTNALEDQLKGSDLILSIPSKGVFNAVVDEKAQLYYLNGGLPTFAFELNFLNKFGKRMEGWLTDKGKRTEYYQLLFLKAKENFTSTEEIEQVEYILVKRQSVVDFIGLKVKSLRVKGIEVSNCKDFRQEKDVAKNYYFTHSTKLAESPVNIILRKRALKNFALLHGFC